MGGSLRDVGNECEAYILCSPYNGRKEYFIVENRWPGNSCESLPDFGLAVWHIDESFSGFNDVGRRCVQLVWAGTQGDNLMALFDKQDPSPNVFLWRDGIDSGLRITNVPPAASYMSAYFDIPKFEVIEVKVD
jgi:hypothetical protein